MAQLVKNLPAMQVDLDSINGLRRSPAEGKGYPRQYSGLENSMDGIVHGVTKSRTESFLKKISSTRNWQAGLAQRQVRKTSKPPPKPVYFRAPALGRMHEQAHTDSWPWLLSLNRRETKRIKENKITIRIF